MGCSFCARVPPDDDDDDDDDDASRPPCGDVGAMVDSRVGVAANGDAVADESV